MVRAVAPRVAKQADMPLSKRKRLRCRIVDGTVGSQAETLGVYRIDPAAKTQQIQHVNTDRAHRACGRLIEVGAPVLPLR